MQIDGATGPRMTASLEGVEANGPVARRLNRDACRIARLHFRQQRLEALAVALKELSTTDAACLLLIVVHGFTAAEAGRVLDASPQAVAKRLSRAKQRLLALYLAHNPASEGKSR